MSFEATRYRLSSPQCPDFVLRLIDERDQEKLRTWKNENRQYFFHQDLIAPTQQAAWFSGYLERAHDYMFMVVWEGRDIGCMGIRLLSEGWDVYNVIAGNRGARGRGIMGQAFKLLLKFAYAQKGEVIGLNVMRTNPAVEWYVKNGFSIVGEGDDYFAMRHDSSTLEDAILSVEQET